MRRHQNAMRRRARVSLARLLLRCSSVCWVIGLLFAPVAGVGELSTQWRQDPRLFKDLDGGMVEISQSKSLGLGVSYRVM